MIHRISIAIVAQVILIVVAVLPADMLRAAFLGARGDGYSESRVGMVSTRAPHLHPLPTARRHHPLSIIGIAHATTATPWRDTSNRDGHAALNTATPPCGRQISRHKFLPGS